MTPIYKTRPLHDALVAIVADANLTNKHIDRVEVSRADYEAIIDECDMPAAWKTLQKQDSELVLVGVKLVVV